jgi:predicted molibdopterin-dependent oxidoreductase YjgC
MGAVPNRLPGLCALDDEAALGRLAQVWGCEPASERGLDVEAMLGEVRGLIIVADDPLVALPAADSARAALAELDCLVVLDAFVTPTVEASHVALPITSPAETDGTLTSMEGRVQWLRACTPPPVEARPGWLVLSELGAALGMPNTHQSVDDILRDIRRAVPSYEEALLPHEGHRVGTAGILQGITGCPRGRALVSGGLRSSNPELRGVSTAGSADGTEFPFQLVRAGSFDWGDDPLVNYSPTLRRDHSSLKKLFPDGLVEMSSQDAERLGIRHGWSVRIKSIHGETVVPVSLREDLDSKILLVPFAFRGHLEPVLNRGVMQRVKVERI